MMVMILMMVMMNDDDYDDDGDDVDDDDGEAEKITKHSLTGDILSGILFHYVMESSMTSLLCISLLWPTRMPL